MNFAKFLRTPFLTEHLQLVAASDKCFQRQLPACVLERSYSESLSELHPKIKDLFNIVGVLRATCLQKESILMCCLVLPKVTVNYFLSMNLLRRHLNGFQYSVINQETSII